MASSADDLHKMGTVPRRTGAGTTKVAAPLAVMRYNEFMGGVDLMDQHLALYYRHLITVRWPINVFRWVMKVAAHNAYVLRKLVLGEKDRAEKDFLGFYSSLAWELIAMVPERKQVSSSKRPIGVATISGRCTGQGTLERTTQRSCAHCQTRRPITRCSKCGVQLCRTKGCWEEYHQQGRSTSSTKRSATPGRKKLKMS